MASFKELWIWKEAHELMLEVHQVAKNFPKEEKYRIKDQIERSSASVPANIAEGYGSYYFNDKIKSMYIARKEAVETQNHLESLVGKAYLDRDTADQWFKKYDRVIAGINSFTNFVRDKRQSGNGIGQGKRAPVFPVSRVSQSRIPVSPDIPS